jgi:pyruvate, orthophosphate dikinase
VVRYVYDFVEGDEHRVDLLGRRGAALAGMVRLGLPVPPGFTVVAEAGRFHRATNEFRELASETSRMGRELASETSGHLPPGLLAEVEAHLRHLEMRVGKEFGDRFDPLLVSVRPDAEPGEPGTTGTVLDVGLTDTSVRGLAARTGDQRFAWDSYRRLIHLFGQSVCGVPGEEFDRALDDAKRARRVTSDTELDAADLRDLVTAYKKLFHAHTGRDFPQAPREQLYLAIRSAVGSGHAAVTVVAMVFGNLGPGSGTGLAFGRDPATGAPGVHGEYLENAQGDDIVRRVRDTVPLSRLADLDRHSYDELLAILAKLAAHHGGPCGVEFTIERGRLWILRTRGGTPTVR